MDRHNNATRVGIVLLWSLLVLSSTCVWAQPIGIGPSQQEPESHYALLSSQTGRFVFGQISESDKDKFMLDTHTGRLWRIAESGKIGLYLTAVPYRNNEGECSPFPDPRKNPEPETVTGK